MGGGAPRKRRTASDPQALIVDLPRPESVVYFVAGPVRVWPQRIENRGLVYGRHRRKDEPLCLRWFLTFTASSSIPMKKIPVLGLFAVFFVFLASSTRAQISRDHAGKPFADAVYKAGAPNLPGIFQCALSDLSGAGIAYQDSDSINNDSGKLNLEPHHQKALASSYLWHFLVEEGVSSLALP